jgi:methanogenic corrinoid protein MtbC1
MNIRLLSREFNEAIYDTDRDRALRLIHDAVAQGVTPEEVVFEVVIPSIEQTINRVGGGADLNLAQHFMTAQIASEVTEEMIRLFKEAPKTAGRIVIGTARGDLHTLGKRIVIGCLKAHMVEAVDLGVNVSPERFVDEAVAHGAQVIGISAMMVHTARGEEGCLKVRQLLQERHLEKKIKIIVGGAPYRFDPQLYQTVQADAYSDNAVAAGKTILELIKEVQS